MLTLPSCRRKKHYWNLFINACHIMIKDRMHIVLVERLQWKMSHNPLICYNLNCCVLCWYIDSNGTMNSSLLPFVYNPIPCTFVSKLIVRLIIIIIITKSSRGHSFSKFIFNEGLKQSKTIFTQTTKRLSVVHV